MKILIQNIESGKYNSYLLLLVIFVSSLRLLNLNFEDMQTWDESLYAVRTISIVDHNRWIDQTDDALGGLYSSAHPPLLIWLNAISVKSFGDKPFSHRLPTTLLSIFTILLVFYIPSKRLIGFISSIILSSFYYFYLFSRSGQLDIAYIFFITLGVYYFSNYIDSNTYKNIVFTGIAFGLALYCKIIVGLFLPLGIFTFSILNYFVNRNNVEFKTHIKNLIMIVFIGLILFAPWFIYMFNKYNIQFIDFYFFYHIKARMSNAIENNGKQLSYAFYFNQLLVYGTYSLPLIIMYFNKLKTNKLFLFTFSVFLVEIIMITISKTKLPTYLLPVFPMIAIMVGQIIEDVISQKKVNNLILYILPICFFWSISNDFRISIKSLSFSNFIFNSNYLLILSTILFSFLLISFKNKPRVFGLFVFIFFIIKFVLDEPIELQKSNLRKVSSLVKKEQIKRAYYYYSDKRTSYVLNPQLNYYFGENFEFINIGNRLNEIKSDSIPMNKITDLNFLVIIDNDLQNKQNIVKEYSLNAIQTWKDKYYTIYKVSNASFKKQ